MKIQPKIVPKAKRCNQYNYLPTCGSCPGQDPQSLFRWCSVLVQNYWRHLLFPRSIAQDGTAGGTYQCELHQPPGFNNPLCREVGRNANMENIPADWKPVRFFRPSCNFGHCVALRTRTLSQVWACVKYVPEQSIA